MMRACPRCGVKRLVGGRASLDRLCLACYRAEGFIGRGKRRPMPDQQWKAAHRHDKQALIPQRSWWAVPESEFAESYARELPRLRAIGGDAKQMSAPAALAE